MQYFYLFAWMTLLVWIGSRAPFFPHPFTTTITKFSPQQNILIIKANRNSTTTTTSNLVFEDFRQSFCYWPKSILKKEIHTCVYYEPAYYFYCANGKLCETQPTLHCQCAQGTTKKDSKDDECIEIDFSCHLRPCENGGQCHSELVFFDPNIRYSNYYYHEWCQCANGYWGFYCERYHGNPNITYQAILGEKPPPLLDWLLTQ